MAPLAYILAESGGEATFWLPKSASNLSPNVDWVFSVVLYTSIFFFCVIVGVMTFFVIKYRRRTPNDRTPVITHNTPLEIVWTGVPLVLVVVFFFLGFKGFINYDTPQSDSYVIEVEAQKWNFTFYYPNGGTGAELYVPFNKPVKLVLRSKDVLHALYIPAFRTQRNAVPGRTTEIWFIATRHADNEGFPVFCTQYCGDGHSKMMTRAFVLDEAEFQKKLAELANPFKEKDAAGKEHWVPYVTLGKKLATASGCFQCHTVDGKTAQGPTWQGLYKRDLRFSVCDVSGYSLRAGDSDEKWNEYLKQHILTPGMKVVEGFPNVMPNFSTQFGGPEGSFKDEKLRALIEYIKSLGPNYAGPRVNGKVLEAKDVSPEVYDVKQGKTDHPESLKAQAAGAKAEIQ
jgi:cytochrome c oxidase subunit II